MFFILSISHKTAPAEIRECFALSQEEQRILMSTAVSYPFIEECAVLCTCNRTEFYFCGSENSILKMQEIIAEIKKFNNDEFIKYYSVYSDKKAVKHLFKVTAGFESMLLGEDEILGQVKNAFAFSQSCGASGYFLNTVSKSAVTCAKKIKTDTAISRLPVSFGTLAANAASDFGGETKTVLIIGISGKIGSITAKNLLDKKNINIIGSLRNHNNIFDFCSEYPNVDFVDYADRYKHLDMADVVISATSSPHYTITYEEAEKHIQTFKPRLYIDLAMPADIDKSIMKLRDASLLDIDSFRKQAQKNNEIKIKEAERSRYILDQELDDTLKTLCYHEYMNCIPEIKEIIKQKGFENFVYKIRDTADSQQLETVMSLFKSISESEE